MSGRPFERGNKAGKGRPPGSRNKKTKLLQLLEGRGEAIVTKAMFMALNGDRSALRLCMDRLVPVAPPPATRFRLPKNKGELDMKESLQSILKQTASGRLSTQQALDLAAFAETYARTSENTATPSALPDFVVSGEEKAA
jgi:hypothetical protein